MASSPSKLNKVSKKSNKPIYDYTIPKKPMKKPKPIVPPPPVPRRKRKKGDILYFEESVKTVLVHFENFFGEEAGEYNEFVISLASKKAYFKMINLIVDENNAILNRDKKLAENFLYRYYSLKRYIDDLKYQNRNYKVFLSDLYGLFEEKFVHEIKQYVNENYIYHRVNEYNPEKQNYEAGITFLDYHIKILYVISRMMRFVIPLCIHYIHTYPGTVDTTTFLVTGFVQLFNIAQTTGSFGEVEGDEEEMRQTDVYQKLYMFVQRKVEKTLHTDAVMWERQAFLGVNPKTATEDIMNKLITNIMPQYMFERIIMNLNAVMTKKTVTQYILRKKDPYNISMIVDTDASQVNDDSLVSDTEIYDSYSNKKNELTLLIRKFFITDTIEKIMERNNVTITPSEFKFYHDNNKIHNFQTFAIFQTFFKYFGGTENIYSCTKGSYVQLLIILTKMLDTVETGELIKYVTGTRTRHYINKRESRSLRNTIAQDPVYKTILETKYSNVQNVIRRNNFIESKILFLINNEFVYNMYGVTNNGSPIERNEEEIKESVLKFFSRLIL